MAKTTRQTAAITGAGDGIGRALAINLNERGIDLTSATSVKSAWIQRWQCWTQPGHLSPQPWLIAATEEIEAWAATITAENDCLDFLFNNAGVAYGAQFREASLDNFEWLMNINYWGVVWCTKALYPY